MDFMKKRKLNALLNGFGSRAATSSSTSINDPHPDLDPDLTNPPATPPSNRNSTPMVDSPSSSTIRTPGSDSMALRYSHSSLPRPTASNEFDLTKRRRLGLEESTPAKQLSPTPHSGAQAAVSNVVLRKWSGHNDKKSIFKPRFCPGDRDELLKRLASFQELTDWTPKPDPVNEVQWAKRGWICQGKERVRCLLCNKELVVKLNKKEVDGKEVAVLIPSEIEDALVEKYVELIITSHDEDCLWRKRGCDDALLRLPLSNRHNAIMDLRRRYDELCARSPFIPYEFNLRLPEKLDIDVVLSQLPPDFFDSPPPAATNMSRPTPNRVALVLALCGWEGFHNQRMGPVPNTASCHTCLRRLGLWMFKSKEIDPETNQVLVPAPMDHLDPVREHRFFCPWKSVEAQQIRPEAGSTRRARLGAEEDMCGWEILLQVIKNEAYLREREAPRRRTAGTPTVGSPKTPRHGAAVGDGRSPSSYASTPGPDGPEAILDDEVEDEKTLQEQDKKRWARLRKVKGMLSGHGARKLRQSFSASRPGSSALSRPGTSHSTAQNDDTATPDAEATHPTAAASAEGTS
ncbi:unnamed protein product [Discula destructiva]